MSNDQAYENTDTELYREPGASPGMMYYQPSIHVTKNGKIGMDVGGRVIVMSIRDWHAKATDSDDDFGLKSVTNYEPTKPVSPNTNIDDRKAIERILVKHHLPEKAPGEKLWGEYIDVVLDLQALLSTAKIEELESLTRIYKDHIKASVMLDLKERIEALKEKK